MESSSAKNLKREKFEKLPSGYIYLDEDFNFKGYYKTLNKDFHESPYKNFNREKVFLSVLKSVGIERENILEYVKIPVYRNDNSLLNALETIINNTNSPNLQLDMNEQKADFIRNASKIIALKDEYTAFHCNHVQKYAAAMAKYLGFDIESQNKIFIASELHDIGKIIVNDKLITKKEILTDKEFDEIKYHSEKGYDILSSIENFSEIAEVVRQHHERFDGKGYPDGLKGYEIHVMARIIGLVDAFDAMTTDRPYRKSLSVEMAIAELMANKDTQFDAKLVDLFVFLLRNGLINVENYKHD